MPDPHETEQRYLSGDNFTVTYRSKGRHVVVSVERDPLGWVMHSRGRTTLLEIRAPADLVLRACLELSDTQSEPVQ